MPKNTLDLLHTVMTNHIVIVAVAILLFLLVILLVSPSTSGEIGELWI